MMRQLNGILALDDGTVIQGQGFGAEKEVAAELVFNTSMGGYEEALTDSSYKGQILMMTYPLMGNYGVRDKIFESDKIQVEGFLVRDLCEFYSHLQSKMTLDEFLKKHGIPGQLRCETFTDVNKAKKFIEDLNAEVAIKPIGLTGGKGVRVSGDHFNGVSEAMEYVKDVINKEIGGSAKVLI